MRLEASSAFLLVCLILTACTTNKVITRQEAVDIGLKALSNSRPEISAAQVTPTNVDAEQMTFGEAVKRIGENNNVGAGYTPDMLVWLVTSDGVWLDEFPRPTGLPAPEPYHHAAIIIDAKTGLEIESSLRP